jgi:Fe-S cluster assembly protein SufB
LADPLSEGIEALETRDLLGYAAPVKKAVELRGRISRSMVEEISRIKGEPDWMRRLRLRSLEFFEKLPMPNWVYGIDEINLDELVLYSKPDAPRASSWEELPETIRRYYEKLRIPEIEARFLGGLVAQYESEAVYSGVKEKLRRMGVIVLPMDEAVKKYPDLVKKYFMRIYPPAEHKFAALHGALWSGGIFVYVPPGVKVQEPLESFFIIGAPDEGQFEHSLIIVDEGASLQFIEGCAAPILKRSSFHDGMVEVYAHRNARISFTSLQNWGRDIINFGNKRAIAEAGATVEWVEGSIGSKISYIYPSTILRGEGASTSITSVTLAKGPYIKDGGAKVFHAAPNTRSSIASKAISAEGGLTVHRGLIRVLRGARNSLAVSQCDALILDERSRNYTYPHTQVDEPTASVVHEATAGRLSEEQLFYMTSRGLSENEAKSLVVLGFLSDVLKNIPLELASLLRKVVQLEFSELGGVG